MSYFQQLQQRIVTCQKCPRLVEYIGNIKKKYPDYWCKPVPGFGDEQARILLLGLAPGRFGSNRTGRMFTGDASGNFLYPALHIAGLSNQAQALNVQDGLKLRGAFITAVARCAPPQNKPTLQELNTCQKFVQEEINGLNQLKVVVALGKIAHDHYLKIYGLKLSHFPFKHGAMHMLKNAPILLDSYHPSRQNTQTGVLNQNMFLTVLNQAKKLSGI